MDTKHPETNIQGVGNLETSPSVQGCIVGQNHLCKERLMYSIRLLNTMMIDI